MSALDELVAAIPEEEKEALLEALKEERRNKDMQKIWKSIRGR